MLLTPCPPRDGSPIDVLRVGPERGLGGRVEMCLQSDQFDVSVGSDLESVRSSVVENSHRPECLVISDDDVGVDPLSLASRIRARAPHLPIVLCTTDEHAYEPQAVLDAGVTTMVTESDLADKAGVRQTIEELGRQYRRRMQDRQDASLLETMFERLPVHLFAKDRSARHVRASSALYDPEMLHGKTDFEVWPADRERGDNPHEDDLEVLETGASIHNEEEYSPVEDGWFLVSKVPWHDEDDLVGLAGLAINVTDRKRREEELQATSKLLSTIVQTSPAAIVVHDIQGTVQFWNPAAADLFGWSPSEAIREPYPPYLPDDKRQEFHAIVADVIESGSIGPVEVRRQTKEGRPLDLQLSAAVLDDEDGNPSRVVSALTDVTELKERERRLKRQNDRLEQFTRVLAHDLRNPVQVIRGQLDREEGTVDPALIRRASNRIEAIVDDVLSVARADPLVTDTETISLGAVSRSVWEQLDASEATLAIESDCSFEGNRARLHRLLAHLFENAIEHGGESVTVTVGCLENGFYVADDGPGIADSDREHVFEPGYSTEPNATGFGLNVVREITEAHGWSIELAEADDGTRFEISGVEALLQPTQSAGSGTSNSSAGNGPS